MTAPENKRINKVSRNYYYNISALLPFVFLLATGIIVLRYHSGTDKSVLTFGINGNNWLTVHRIAALVIIPIILGHLLMHLHWLKQIFTFRMTGKNSGMTLTLLIIFLMCALTALLAWQVFDSTKLAEALREVHSKLGLLLIVFWGIHLYNYSRWLINMTKIKLGAKK